MNPTEPTPQAHEREPTHSPVLTLDLEKYLGGLKDWDISEDQKTEFIYTLWNILRNFAEIGFEIHPAQQAQKQSVEPTRKTPEIPDLSTICADYVLSSSPDNQPQLEDYNEGSAL